MNYAFQKGRDGNTALDHSWIGNLPVRCERLQ
jgi:hypothetical protein